MTPTSTTIRMSEAELAKDLHSVLEKVRQGVEVSIEQDNRIIAVLTPSKPVGRLLSEIVADLRARGSDAFVDDDFARDIEEGMKMSRAPWNPPSWE